MVRETLQTAPTNAAPLRILMLTLPLWGFFVLLMFFMPFTGLIGAMVVGVCVFILPFTARRGLCPKCNTPKTLAFSGLGSRCKGCSKELVLRQKTLHLIADRHHSPRSS